MTEDEKRQQKAMLLLDYQEAEQNLAHLKEKARRKAAPFEEVARWLNWAASIMQQGYDIDDRKKDANIRANLDAFRREINFDEVLALMDEIVSAEKSLRTLQNRKTELGLK